MTMRDLQFVQSVKEAMRHLEKVTNDKAVHCPSCNLALASAKSTAACAQRLLALAVEEYANPD